MHRERQRERRERQRERTGWLKLLSSTKWQEDSVHGSNANGERFRSTKAYSEK
jgi:hypothetical protein